jgi:hypothetical protein
MYLNRRNDCIQSIDVLIRAFKNSTPSIVDLQTLGRISYQYQLPCHAFDPHHHFHLTHRLLHAAPPRVGATQGSST